MPKKQKAKSQQRKLVFSPQDLLLLIRGKEVKGVTFNFDSSDEEDSSLMEKAAEELQKLAGEDLDVDEYEDTDFEEEEYDPDYGEDLDEDEDLDDSDFDESGF